jgi:hypothetical protein
MKTLRFRVRFCAAILVLGAASPALALANRVFVSARSGNDLNSCDNVATPCQTLAGAVAQLNPDGEAIILDSGGYGLVTITQGVTIEAPAGVTAFIHPSGLVDAVTVNAGVSDTVTLRGLVLNVGTKNGITVNSVGTLNVENCSIAGFSAGSGILMLSGGRLNVKGTDVTGCAYGVRVLNTAGAVHASLDHCHLDANASYGYAVATTSPGSSTTTATFTTANNNNSAGWLCGSSTSGKDVLNLEFCSGSENTFAGLVGGSPNASSVARYSNCVFANNGTYGVERSSSGTFESRGNNTTTGNGTAPTAGTIGSYPPL